MSIETEENTPIYASLDEHGAEIPDPTPIALPVGYVRPPSLHDQLAMFGAASQRYYDYHTDLDEDDFVEHDDDGEPLSVHEEQFHSMAGRLLRKFRSKPSPASPDATEQPRTAEEASGDEPDSPASDGGDSGK